MAGVPTSGSVAPLALLPRPAMDLFNFDETLVLARRVAIPPARAGGAVTHLYFSALARDGKNLVVCISVIVPQGARTTLHPPGTRAHVMGCSRLTRATLMVAAGCVLPLAYETSPVKDSPAGLLWAALVLGGVVPDVDLVTSHPSLSLMSIRVQREDDVATPTVVIECSVGVAGAISGVLELAGAVKSYSRDSLVIEVYDVRECKASARAGPLTAVWSFFRWLGSVLHLVDVQPGSVDVALSAVELLPSMISLALDDNGHPSGGFPQLIVSTRRALSQPTAAAPLLTRYRIYSGVSPEHVRERVVARPQVQGDGAERHDVVERARGAAGNGIDIDAIDPALLTYT